MEACQSMLVGRIDNNRVMREKQYLEKGGVDVLKDMFAFDPLGVWVR